MGIKQCKTCNNDIAKSAKRCPHCGEEFGDGCISAVINLIIFLVVLSWFLAKIAK